jgi:hypothetical protein
LTLPANNPGKAIEACPKSSGFLGKLLMIAGIAPCFPGDPRFFMRHIILYIINFEKIKLIPVKYFIRRNK